MNDSGIVNLDLYDTIDALKSIIEDRLGQRLINDNIRESEDEACDQEYMELSDSFEQILEPLFHSIEKRM